MTPLREPTYGADLPLYPPPLQLLRVTAATVPGPAGVAQTAGSSVLGPTLYVAFTQQMRTDALLPRDREPCLADDVNGLGLVSGFYLGRLAGSFNSLPVYEVVERANDIAQWMVSFLNQITTINQTLKAAFYVSLVANINTNLSFSQYTIYFTNQATINFGITVNPAVKPPGILSKPTLIVTGAPTWVPDPGTFPWVWGAYDHIDWQWDGRLLGPSTSSSVPGRSGWVPFVSVGRTAVNDASVTAITTDRVLAYTAISTARTVTLPPASSLPAGFIMRIVDESGQASATNTISFAPAAGNSVNKSGTSVIAVSTAFGGAEAENNGVDDWTVKLYPVPSAASLGLIAPARGNAKNTATTTTATSYGTSDLIGVFDFTTNGGDVLFNFGGTFTAETPALPGTNAVRLKLTVDGTDLGSPTDPIGSCNFNANETDKSIAFTWIQSLSAATHAVKVQWHSTAGSGKAISCTDATLTMLEILKGAT